MFDLRYHVASLAAVFLALIIGILVGVGISSGGFVSKSERSLLNARVAKLESRLDAATRRAGELDRTQRAAETFIEDTYPALMQDRLRGRRIALVFVGSVNPRLRSLVERTLEDAGAPGLLRARAMKVPIDVRALDKALAARPALTRYIGDAKLDDLGRRLAQEFVAGGESPLWRAVSSQLVEERSGSDKRPADAVVVVRSVAPQQAQTARFLAGFYAGLSSSGAPAVGVEESVSAIPSAVAAFAKADISSVDDIDAAAGRLALAQLLGGAQPGHYGSKSTAKDGMLPPVEPPQPSAQTSG